MNLKPKCSLMKKREARNIALQFILSAEGMLYEVMHKHAIDDSGTQSKTGYDGEEYDMIEKEIVWLLGKLEQYRPSAGRRKIKLTIKTITT